MFNGTLVSCSYDKTITFWSLSGERIKTLTGHTGSVHVLAVFNGKLVSGSDDKTIKWWNEDGVCTNTLLGHATRPLSMCSAFHDQRLVSGERFFHIRFWDREGKCVQTIDEDYYLWSLVAFGDLVASGASNDVIKIWNIDGECLRTMRIDDHDVDERFSIAFHGDQLISASYRLLHIWNYMEEKLITTTRVHSENDHTCMISEEEDEEDEEDEDNEDKDLIHGELYFLRMLGDLLVVGYEDGAIVILDKDGMCIKALIGHHEMINTIVEWNGMLVSCSNDLSMRFWSAV